MRAAEGAEAVETWVALWLAAAVVGYAVSRIRIYITLRYRRVSTDDSVAVDVALLNNIIHYHIDIPVVRIAERYGLPWLESKLETGQGEVETKSRREQVFIKNTWDIYRFHPRKWRTLLRTLRYYTRLYKKFTGHILARMTCEKLFWRTRLGTEDAALTSLASGALWAFKSQVYVYLKRRVKFAVAPAFQVSPIFNAAAFDVEFECIFSIRLGNVINAMLSLVNFPLKGETGSGRTPNSKFDENSYGKH
jgi:hypothetical protein